MKQSSGKQSPLKMQLKNSLRITAKTIRKPRKMLRRTAGISRIRMLRRTSGRRVRTTRTLRKKTRRTAGTARMLRRTSRITANPFRRTKRTARKRPELIPGMILTVIILTESQLQSKRLPRSFLRLKTKRTTSRKSAAG